MLQATGQIERPNHRKNPAAVTLGRLGGLKGGKARAEKLSPAKRKAIAKKAAESAAAHANNCGNIRLEVPTGSTTRAGLLYPLISENQAAK
jgi:hypothetical protein